MKTVTTSIIPSKQIFAKVEENHALNYEAICVFAATGFFLDQDTYWRDQTVLKPGSIYTLDDNSFIINSKKNFDWHYEPRPISFKTALDEFTDLFESIVKEQSGTSKVLLPLSGGLDSRTQAAALKYVNANVHSYSYSFLNGFKEHEIGRKIAETCAFKFDIFLIKPSYLWQDLDEMARINGCYSEFTHPRQMAVLNNLKQMQGQFSLGHWGDVLFDKAISESDHRLSDMEIIFKKVVKKGGLELASKLWKNWNLDGDFESYFKQRIQDVLNKIDIENRNAKIRAFKSLHWAPRWTSVSLSFFEAAHPVNLPYYDDRMCQFICGIPEAFLADRKIQIAYIKNRNPKLAAIPWQDHMPFNLFDYNEPHLTREMAYRLKNKAKREINAIIGRKFIQRNWELQFLGKSNARELERYILDSDFATFLGGAVAEHFYEQFKTNDAVFYSHPVSMLLTLSAWFKKEKNALFIKK